MKIRVKIGDLVEQITQAAITVDHKSEGALGKVYLRAAIRPAKDGEEKESALYLFSTDNSSKTFIKIKIEEVIEEGQILVEASKLLGALLGRDPTGFVRLSIQPDDKRIEIKVGKNVAHLAYDIGVEKPAATIKEMMKTKSLAKISAATLIEFIRRSSFCIPTEDNGQQLFAMGVLNLRGSDLKYTAQATDGAIIASHVATQSETTKYDLPSILIPYGALDPLSKILAHHKADDVEILEGKRSDRDELQEVFFKMEGVQFGTVLRIGKFPNIPTLLEQHQPTYQLTLKKDELKGTLQRANSFVETGTDKRCVRLNPEDEKTLKIEASNPMSDLKDEIESELGSGVFKSVNVLINIDYLANVTSAQSGVTVSLGFNSDKSKALIITEKVDGMETCYAMMPIIPEKGKKAKSA